MIGARTLAALAVCGLAFVWAGARGVLDPAYLAELAPSAALIIGIFASLASVVVIGLWHPEGASIFAVGIHRGRLVAGAAENLGRRSLDVPVAGQRLLYLIAFLAIGAGSFSNASADELAGAWASASGEGSEYCREVAPEDEAEPAAPLADQRGCALIRRAYELGYEKSLGSCAPKEGEAAAPSDDEESSTAPPCDGRLRGEPLLHYTWRRLKKRTTDAEELGSDFSFSKSYETFRIKLDYVEPLLEIPTQAILASPHAAHHVWTNLPAPRDRSWLGDTFSPSRCTNPAAHTAPGLDWSGASRPTSALFESAIGQLLLNRRYGPPPISCDEVTIHWGAEKAACAALAEAPQAFLKTDSALESVQAVAARHRALVAQHELRQRLGEGTGEQPPPLSRVVSFSCLMIDEALDKSRRERFVAEIAGARIDVRMLSIARLEPEGAAQLEVYQAVAELLSGARYAGAIDDSKAARLRLAAEIDPGSLELDDFSLARLEVLADADPFIRDDWALERADLTEVYPFEAHLRRVVESFRRRFSRLRGRL